MIIQKQSLNINISSIDKFWEREYCVFTISSYELSIKKILKYGGAFLNLAFYVFQDQKVSHYRDILLQDRVNEIMSEKLIKNKRFREDALLDYNNAGDFLEKAFKQIEKNKKISSNFIKKYCQAFGDLSAGVLLVQRCPDYLLNKKEHKKLLDRLIYLRNRFEYIFGRAYERYLDLMLEKISKDKRIDDFQDLKYLNFYELIEFNESGELPNDLLDRKKISIILILLKHKPKFFLFSGENAKKIFKQIKRIEQKRENKKNIEDIQGVIKGVSAYSGKIKGKVQVIQNFNNLNKLKKGNILVVPSTIPKYENYYHKALAIVADEGGVLSHIAIFCREFKKIGLYGTKIATKVLNNGDEVEIDADKGVLRIIKRVIK